MKVYLSAVVMLLWGYICCSAKDAISSEGLNFALLGDSMTWIGGDSCENATGWSHILKESGIAASISTYARSGATWTNTANTHKDTDFYSELLHDDNVVYNQVLRLIEDQKGSEASTPDHIILFAGANDAWFADRRPGIYSENDSATPTQYCDSTDPNTVTSLYGSVSLVCDLLQKHFPDAVLTVVTPLQMSKVSAETIHKTADIIEEAAKSKGCDVLRADKEVGITHESESKSPTYTYDGVHTNPEGARLVGYYILQHLPAEKVKNQN